MNREPAVPTARITRPEVALHRLVFGPTGGRSQRKQTSCDQQEKKQMSVAMDRRRNSEHAANVRRLLSKRRARVGGGGRERAGEKRTAGGSLQRNFRRTLIRSFGSFFNSKSATHVQPTREPPEANERAGGWPQRAGVRAFCSARPPGRLRKQNEWRANGGRGHERRRCPRRPAGRAEAAADSRPQMTPTFRD